MVIKETDRNLILTGFMGTGKSAVGCLVAEQLGRPFVDLDVYIEEQAGKSVKSIFRDDGEQVFRRLEAAACQTWSYRLRRVIATGGGALVSGEFWQANLDYLSQGGHIFCLHAQAQTVLERTRLSSTRPLLSGQIVDIERLLAERDPLYGRLPRHISTDGKTIEAVAQEVLKEWQQLVTIK